MNTTVLFAEILISGLQASLWVFLVILDICGIQWLQFFSSPEISEWKTIITIFLLSVFYVAGIAFDRISDFIFSGWYKKIQAKIFPNIEVVISTLRFQLGNDNEYLNRQIEYIRSRIRLARSAALNFGMTTISALPLILTRISLPEEKNSLFYLVLVGGILLVMALLFAWYQLTGSYFRLVKAYWDLCSPTKKKKLLGKVY